MISGNEVFRIIESYEREIDNPSFYVGRNIPEKKERNAVQAYGDNGIRSVYALYDGTILGSAKEGLLFTERSLFYHYLFDKWVVDYDEIVRLEIERSNQDRSNPKNDILCIITRRDEFKLEISPLDKRVLRAMLEDICGFRYSRDNDRRRYDDYPPYDDRRDDDYRRRDDERRYDDRYDRYPDRYDDRNRRR